MLSQLFRSTPKWQSPKAQKRIEALTTLAPGNDKDDWILLKLAREDSDATVRCEAVAHVQDPDIVSQIHKRDADGSVRDAAARQLHALLAGKTTPPLPLPQRLEQISRLTGTAQLTQLVADADSTDIRLAAIAGIKDEAELEKIARESTIARLRQSAAERIHTPERLEAIAEATRQKDKNVYRIVRARLDERLQQTKQSLALKEKREALCNAMEAHARTALNPLYAAKTESLRQQWLELAQDTPDSALSERFETALALAGEQVREVLAAQQRTADEAQAREEQQQCVATLETTLHEYQGQEDFDLPALAALRKTQHLRWELALRLSAAPEALSQRHATITTQLDHLEQMLQQWQQDKPVVEATLAGLAQAEDAEHTLSLTTLHGLRENYLAHRLPLPALLRDIPGLPEVVVEQAPAPADDTDLKARRQKLQALLDTVATEVEAGNSRNATRQLRKARDYSKEHHLHDNRFAELAERVRELQSWAGFAVQPKKEDLISRMQALITHVMDPDDKADAIHALQEEWKALGVADASIEQPLWERFKRLGDEAFEPCRAHFAAQRELRQQNLQKRTALCEQLDNYLRALPETPDWKAHDTILRTARQEWQQYSPSDRQHTRALQERFNALLKALEAPLQEARKKNETAKRTLITQATALLQQEDLRAACDKARQLQQEWKGIGQAHPKADRQLWQDFRAACDALFSKRDAEFKARQAEREASVQEAESLITAMTELAQGDAQQLRSAAERLDDAFRALPLPKEKSNLLREKFQAARKQVDNAAREQQAAAQRQKLENRIKEWESLTPPGESPTEEKIQTLLLDLEILLDLPTPEPWQAERRQRQMQQLQSRGLRKAGNNEAESVLAELLKTPPSTGKLPEASQRLRQILEKLV